MAGYFRGCNCVVIAQEQKIQNSIAMAQVAGCADAIVFIAVSEGVVNQLSAFL
jgi:hypothetical protein